MMKIIYISLLIITAFASLANAEEGKESDGKVFTLWPFLDYRMSADGTYSNLSLLGPVIKRERNKNVTVTAFRPLWYSLSEQKEDYQNTDILYPVASYRYDNDNSSFQFLKIIGSDESRINEPDEEESSTMIFPIFIKGESKTHGSYWSLFPIYGDIYGKFFKDEYHFALFPLYGRTVNKGSTNYNVLWPFFGVTSGENEKGFRFWPLYGQSSKKDVYESRFALWPLYSHSKQGLNLETPSESLTMFPFYNSLRSENRDVTDVIWPFFGYENNRGEKYERKNYLWPLFWSASGEGRDAISLLPFYMSDVKKSSTMQSTKNWYLWPLYKSERFEGKDYSNDSGRVLFFLYSDQNEIWSKDETTRFRSAFWPLYTYRKDQKGTRRITFPAPIEPILARDGVENSWTPLWRIFITQWDNKGNSATSILWNLYWREANESGSAWELYPLLRYTGNPRTDDFLFLKGMVRYRKNNNDKRLSFFWLDFGFSWKSDSSGGS